MTRETRSGGTDFIRAKIDDDNASGKFAGRVVTRFPPEPNGFLHIGHAKAICLNFGLALEYPGARCHLRFDDTNPETEDIAYVRSIIEDVKWLGFDWREHLYYASDYFGQMYDFAEHMIRTGDAYVDSSSEDEIRAARGTVTEPGHPTAFRDRSVAENLDLFQRMRAGEFPNGTHVLRARIDLGSPNMLMRDPVLYRIRHATHYRTGDDWCVYPLYDYAHPIEDALECVTHSLCTLEFENNRELYDWVVEHLPRRATAGAQDAASVAPDCRPEQTEFARLALDYTVMSKRKLLRLVKEGDVAGWDDPRMPTIAGLRRRGLTPDSIRAFCDLIGIAKTNSRVDIGKLEYVVRDDLNRRAPRVMCVLRPLKVVITNFPEGETKWFEAPSFPRDVDKPGSRSVPFSREILIERDDFREDPPRGFFRLSPGAEVRLKYAYVIRCDEVVKSADGTVIQLHCSLDPETEGGSSPAGRKVKGTLHWVSAAHGLPCEARLYDRLFAVPDPEADDEVDFREHLNPESLVLVDGAHIEPAVAGDPPGSLYQFERQGYFCRDLVDSQGDRLVFNRTVTLRDTWARVEAQAEGRTESVGRPERGAGEPHRAAADSGSTAPPERERPPRSPALEKLFARYHGEIGLSEDEADVLTRDDVTATLFEDARAALHSPVNSDQGGARALAKWIVNEIPRELRGQADLPFTAASLGRLVALMENGELSSSAAREVFAEMAERGGDPVAIVERRGLRQLSDESALDPIVAQVLANDPDKVSAYRAGKTGLLGYFVGQVMRRTQGKADPERTNALLRERLEG